MPKLESVCGNKGEWSEVYVLLHLLATGRLYAATEDLKQIPDFYYEILKIMRNEQKDKKDKKDKNFEFKILKDKKVIEIIENGQFIGTFPMEKFNDYAKKLYSEICRKHKESAFSVPDVEDFLNSFDVKEVKAPRSKKKDICLYLHDTMTSCNVTQGFSIKSRLGSASTLFNASKATNFTFAVNGPITKDLIDTFNKTKIFKEKFEILTAGGCSIAFDKIENQKFYNNLRMIDGNLPEICAHLLEMHYIRGISPVTEALEELERENPLDYDMSQGQKFYQHKFKAFLYASALGMQPSKPWDGEDDATGGYIIVKEDGQVLCYHVYNRNEFNKYLLQNTRFDTGSTKANKADFGKIYEKDGKYYVKLNLQVRFIK